MSLDDKKQNPLNILQSIDKFLDDLLDKLEKPKSSITEFNSFWQEVTKNVGVPYIEIPEEIIKFRQTLGAESDRGCALTAAAYLDSELEKLLRSYLVDDKKVINEIFSFHGPLSSFSSRIDLAYSLGLIGSSIKRDLDLIRKIRNLFAHEPGEINFTDDHIAARCNELYYDVWQEKLPPRKKFMRVVIGVLAAIHFTNMNITHRESPQEIQLGDKEIDKLRNQIKEASEAARQKSSGSH